VLCDSVRVSIRVTVQIRVSTMDRVRVGTVKPLMIACPLFCEFCEPNKTAKLRARISTAGQNHTKLLQYFELHGFNLPK